MLKFYYGTMGAGKTTELIKTYDIYRRKGLNPVVIKPAVDDREGEQLGWGTTKSRITSEEIPAYYFKDLKKELPQLDYGVLLVDEAQFMTPEDIKYMSSVTDNKNVDVLAYGLKTDVNANLFPGAAALLAIADTTKELENLCQMPDCANLAQVHIRFINGVPDTSHRSVVIDKGDVTYKAICRKCYEKQKGY